jgi:hypothetical protein
MDWLQALDVKRALANVRTDILGDWYRDPWDWPELKYVVEDAPELIIGCLNEKGARRSLSIDVPKENFMLRPASVLDPLDRLCYQAMVDTISKSLIGSLRGWAYGWRLLRKTPNAGDYSSNKTEWDFYRERLRFLALTNRYGLTTDVVSFFATISIPHLMEDIRSVAGSGKIVSRLGDFLDGIQTVPNRSGLPQRYWASSVLAHFALRSIDDFLDGHVEQTAELFTPSPKVVRWMDDVWVFGDESQALRLLQLDLQRILTRAGLRMNAGKTDLLEGEDLAETAMQIEHSAVDSALDSPDSDIGPLSQMVERILAAPEQASRTSIRFATTRMRKHKVYDRAHAFVDAALRMPQGADHIARLSRDCGAWKELSNWYVGLSRDLAEKLPWVIYQLGTMFPSVGEAPQSLATYWADELSAGRLPGIVAPLAAQRLSAWDAERARLSIQSAVTKPAYEHPFILRAFALAGRTSGIPVTETRQVLRQFGELDVTHQFLNAREMKPVNLAPDFPPF